MSNIKIAWLASTALVLAASVPAPRADAAAAIPDFSGQWARSSLGFESPAAGHGPVENRNRLPDGTNNFRRLEGDYTDPLLKPAAAAALERLDAISRRGEAFPQPANQCLPYPPPYSLSQNQEIDLLQEKDRVTILTMFDHQFRTVWLNAEHPAHVTPSWYGDSVGHFEGDTLVVDTVSIKPGRYPMVDIYGTPFSTALHLIERFRLISNKDAFAGIAKGERQNHLVTSDGVEIDRSYKGPGLEIEFTVEDPNMFTQPWHGTVTYVRPMGEWQEMVCAENIREYYADKDTAIPAATKPDF